MMNKIAREEELEAIDFKEVYEKAVAVRPEFWSRTPSRPSVWALRSSTSNGEGEREAGEGGERETRGYEPFALQAPIH
jgi:hypothetical protein